MCFKQNSTETVDWLNRGLICFIFLKIIKFLLAHSWRGTYFTLGLILKYSTTNQLAVGRIRNKNRLLALKCWIVAGLCSHLRHQNLHPSHHRNLLIHHPWRWCCYLIDLLDQMNLYFCVNLGQCSNSQSQVLVTYRLWMTAQFDYHFRSF